MNILFIWERRKKLDDIQRSIWGYQQARGGALVLLLQRSDPHYHPHSIPINLSCRCHQQAHAGKMLVMNEALLSFVYYFIFEFHNGKKSMPLRSCVVLLFLVVIVVL